MKALSLAQQRLWFLAQWEPTMPALALMSAIELCGALDHAALRASFDALAQRHEALRTTVRMVEGQPTQRRADRMIVPVRVVDLRAIPHAQRAAEAERLASAEARDPFDLTHGPLVRTTLLALDQGKQLLLLSLHRLIADEESLQIAIRELAALYAGFTAGTAPADPAPVAQHADFIARQTEWLGGEAAVAQLAYWRTQLANLPTLDLPADRPRPPTRSYRGGRRVRALDAELRAALTQLGHAEGVTLPTVLLSGFAALLARYTGQTDIVIGLPISGRAQADTGAIGCYAHALVFRTDLSGDPSFRALLQHVRTTWLQAEVHRDLPFERLIAELRPERDPSRSPLFQVTFAAESIPPPAYEAGGLTFRQRPIERAATEFDLALRIVEEEQRLSVIAEYASDIFDGPMIARLLEQFHTLLAGVVATPDRRIGTLPLLPAAEGQQLLAEWNDTLREVRGQGSGVSRIDPVSDLLTSEAPCLHTLIEEQAARTPDAIALVFDETTNDQRSTTNDQQTTTDDIQDKETRRQGDKEIQARRTDKGSVFSVQRSAFIVQLTYQELNARANQLARHLQTLGVGPEVLVGICIERSIALLVGLLGILKAGGAYLPLDPAYPAERITFMLEDSGAAVVVTMDMDSGSQTRRHGDTKLADLRVSVSPGLLVSRTVVDLIADWPTIAQQSTMNLDSAVAPEHLAYVIYTSGSTGRPKGVLVPHRGLANLAEAQRFFGIMPRERVLQFASPSFDASIFEITLALCAGATLCLGALDTLLPGPDLLRLLRDQAVALVTLPPSALALLPGADLPALRLVTVAGEACPPGLVARWAPGRRFFNLYGPTEATVWTTVAACVATEHTLPIGRPIRNTQVYLLDDRLQPVPIGVVGNLYIGGVGLARGYLNRPDLTAERFIPNPFAEVSGIGYQVSEDKAPDTRHPTPGTRLYRTGDLARFRPDGNIEYQGRRDHQVKIRGYRIEMGEVEAALLAAGVLRECVVVARDEAQSAGAQPDRRLVAYVVPAETLNDERRTMNEPERSSSSFIVHPSSFGGELRDLLKTRLPAHMIPSAFVVLDALPKTPNGKLDRRALPPPAETGTARNGPLVRPRTSTEELLASIWAEILRIKEIGIHDSFFDLGGHSLLATQVVSRVNRSFRLKLPIRSLFEAPSIAELASYMIANESQPGQIEKTAQIIQRIKRMSAADVRASLQQDKRGSV